MREKTRKNATIFSENVIFASEIKNDRIVLRLENSTRMNYRVVCVINGGLRLRVSLRLSRLQR